MILGDQPDEGIDGYRGKDSDKKESFMTTVENVCDLLLNMHAAPCAFHTVVALFLESNS